MEKIKSESQNGDMSTEIRQNLVDTAVQFLNMEKILPQPESMKRQFLEKKGLNRDEIEAAFHQSKRNVHVYPAEPNFGNALHQNQLYHSPVPFLHPPVNIWTRVKNLTNMVVFFTGVAFGINYLYKYYVGPYLTGVSPWSKDDSSLEVQKAVMGVLQQIEGTLEIINENILTHNERKLDNSSIEDLRTELKTIKSLLVNRKSFPPPPAISPSIPEWQRISKQKKEEDDENIEEAEWIDGCYEPQVISSGRSEISPAQKPANIQKKINAIKFCSVED